jgi:methanogenic corrinoid protein MtbC1
MKTMIRDFKDALAALDRIEAEALFRRALRQWPAIEAVEKIVVPALEQIGQEWNEGSIALSQIYLSGRLCEELVEQALPPSDPDRKRQPRSAIVTLSDYHLLGKRIVYALMRASGYELFDYGRMDVDELVERAVADRLSILLISVLMLPSALKVREVRAGLEARGARIRIAVGGAPFLFDPELWREVGADAMGRTAADAVKLVAGWMEDAA